MSDIQQPPQEVQWTAKLPLLVLAAVLSIWGVLAICYAHSRIGTLTGIALILIAAVFFGYSLEIKNWCAPGSGSAFSSAFHQSFASCSRMKEWIEW